jgi:hypothetical protein
VVSVPVLVVVLVVVLSVPGACEGKDGKGH